MITIADGVELPAEIVTEVTGILARRGAGKTYTAKKIAEQVIKARLPIVIIDPLGAFWGLRSSADGLSDGLPVVIFGGAHADVPLTSDVGREIATVVVDNPGAYIVDLSHFDTKGEEITFMSAFLERLYRYKAQHPSALLLVIDEADTFAPQRPEPRETKMLGSMESIVRRGRLRGLGVILITQRAAVLNKNVLTQVELLVLLQTTSPQDRKAVEEWIRAKSADDQRKEVMDSLGSLQRGEAWLWSPAWLQILQRAQISPQETFDSSKTPQPGEATIEPEVWATVDIEALGAKIAASKARAAEDDPVVLRKRIAEIEAKSREPERVVEPVAILRAGEPERLETAIEELRRLSARIEEIGESLGEALEQWAPARTAANVATFGEPMISEEVADTMREVVVRPIAAFDRIPKRPSSGIVHEWPSAEEAFAYHGDEGPIARVVSVAATPAGLDVEIEPTPLGKAEKAFLSVLAQFPDGRTKSQAAFLAGYSPNVSTTKNNLSKLRTRGYIAGTGTAADPLRITASGRAALGSDPPTVLTGRALADWWLARLGKADGAFFRVILDAHPQQITRSEAAKRAGYDPAVSTTKNNLSKLRTLGLIVGMDSLGVSPDLGL